MTRVGRVAIGRRLAMGMSAAARGELFGRFALARAGRSAGVTACSQSHDGDVLQSVGLPFCEG